MSLTTRPDGREVIALVATRRRADLLLNRALPSVLAQTLPPSRLVVVVDEGQPEFRGLSQRVGTLVQGRCELVMLRNYRTRRRAAGAWNTGLDWLHRQLEHPDLAFAAVLDDDDAWDPDHLRECTAAAMTRDLHMVGAGLIRHDRPHDEGRRHDIPSTLDPRALFVTGQHIQGSNLFVRLDKILEAGCFDESLPSCTDRDLCIRLADLAGFRYGAVDRHTVHHYADDGRERLSTPSSSSKRMGLARFWSKYAARFDREARERAEVRAKRLFGWSPPSARRRRAVATPPAPSAPPRDVSIVVGLTTDSSCPGHVAGLLDDLLGLSRRARVTGIDVLVLENGPRPVTGVRPLHDLVVRMQGKGLRCYLIDLERQAGDAAAGLFGPSIAVGPSRRAIAVTRTILARYVGLFARERPGSWAWILDDDKRLNALVDVGGPAPSCMPTPDLSELCRLQDCGADIVLGLDTESPPLPFVSSLRTQFVDLGHNLRSLLAMDPTDRLPDRSRENHRWRRRLRDCYYDLSRRDTEQLEAPFWLTPQHPEETSEEALVRIAQRLPRVLAGEQVFRPLMLDSADCRAGREEPSVQRGGSAVFFNPEHLLRVPHTFMQMQGSYTRRSDMAVTLLMRDLLGIRVVISYAAAVRHDRGHVRVDGLDLGTLREDVLGFALYSALNDVTAQRARRRRGEHAVLFTEVEICLGLTKARKYLNERVAAYTLNGHRVLGCAEELRALLRLAQVKPSSRRRSARCSRALADIAAFIDRVLAQFNRSLMSKFATSCNEVPDSAFRSFFESLPPAVDLFQRATQRSGSISLDLAEQRRAMARAQIALQFRVSDLEFLGDGCEGVVSTDGTRVYKWFDRCNGATRKLLRGLLGRWRESHGLYELLEFREAGAQAVLVYPYEPSDPYQGGHGPELVALLRECRSYGLVHRNLHPKNLRVARGRLRLIDYGADLRPYSDNGFREMAKRAWLSWRWHHRPDLAALMTDALHNERLPELDGFERFWRAVQDDGASAAGVVTPLLQEELKRFAPGSVLDFGCGKAGLAVELAGRGVEVTAYDPDRALAGRWQALPGNPHLFLTHERSAALARGPFDAAVCSLVLCELPDGPEYQAVLADLRGCVRDSGVVLTAVCNPFFAFGGPTPLHRRRHLPPGVGYGDSFAYTEIASANGVPRREFHRPLARLQRDLLRAGLAVERTVESQTVDLARFEPASDFLLLVCRPAVLPKPERRVSLMIKTCAMEWRTIEVQVEHLVRQLEGPRAFCERILVVDSRLEGFPRQYGSSDPGAHDQAVARVVSRGLVDRIVRAPEDPREVRPLIRRWFGLDSESSHTAAGAPLTAPLSGFEACTGDYILQVDADVMIGRLDRSHDSLAEMMEVLESDRSAVTVAFNIAHRDSRSYSAHGPSGPWRVEARAALMHRQRLLEGRPYPNALDGGLPVLAWHRSLDQSARAGRSRSFRGGDRRTFFVHPPNMRKSDPSDWLAILDRVEAGWLPDRQLESVDLVGALSDWLPASRAEPYIFVVTGRNVPPGRMRRCLDSMLRQSRQGWGAVVVDDGSEGHSSEYLGMFSEWHADRVTLLQPRARRGQLANMVAAIRHVCTNPESVIITLDLDDALIGDGVLDRVAREFEAGADVTVGSMRRTDKHRLYEVRFDNPRHSRGGNVWQHLRAFRKRLFDRIPDHELRVDGQYIDLATDWAYMIPMVEMATKPVWIRDPLYLYEPSGRGKGVERDARERQIARVLQRRAEATP